MLLVTAELCMCIDNANLILFDFWGLGLCNFFPCEKNSKVK